MSQNILLVDDDPGSIQLMARILSGVAQLRFATTGADALRLAHDQAPDLFLLDAEMPGLNGFQVLEALKAEPKFADIPVIFVTSHREAAFETAGFEMGASDFIAKPVIAPLVLARVKSQLRAKHMADELRRIGTIDSLTAVANRRSFDQSLEREWSRALRSGNPLALLLIDVDHFKAFNDRYGHPAGDICLHTVAQAIVESSLRPADLVARYGGEEFAVLLPATTRGGAQHVAERVLAKVEGLGIVHAASLTAGHVTVSVGVASYDEQSEYWVHPSAPSRSGDGPKARCNSINLLQAADRGLYSAKHAGRGQACLMDIAYIHNKTTCPRLPDAVPPVAGSIVRLGT